jgi:hypothetical protein
VGGVLGPISAPVALVAVHRDERGQLRLAGRTAPIPRPARAGVGQVLRAAGDWHRWRPVLAPARFGGAAPVEYTRVKPNVVIELAVDAAVDMVRGATWRSISASERSCIRWPFRHFEVTPGQSDSCGPLPRILC